MITGLNHITLSCRSLEESLSFYHGLLQFDIEHRWDKGAYLSCGSLWFCLIEKENYQAAPQGNNHLAFNVAQEDFDSWQEKLRAANVQQWQDNSSEGDSFYFLDPDGHQLELHVGNLQSRLASIANHH